MTSVPARRLAELLEQPAQAEGLSSQEARSLLPALSALHTAVLLRALAPAAPVDGDRLLTVREVAAQLGTSPDWVYRHAAQLGAHRLGRALRFSGRALDAALASPTMLKACR